MLDESRVDVPVKTTIPPTVHLCATSKNLLDASTTRSARLICAFCAAMCACRSRRTRCSGVSPGIRGGCFGAAPPAALPAVLEVACGIVEVKRVASLTLRGPILDAMV